MRTALVRYEELLPALPKMGLCLQVGNLLVTFSLERLAKRFINEEERGEEISVCVAPHLSKKNYNKAVQYTHTYTHRDMDEQKYRHLFRVKHISCF